MTLWNLLATLDMKKFIYASILYLLMAAGFGVINGLFELGYIGSFGHAHFSLLGSTAMLLFGFGYYVLPRLSGSNLRFRSWVPIHFWLANVSLVAMVVFRGLSMEIPSAAYYRLFIASVIVQILSALMFVVNVWMSLTPDKISKASEKE
jgi:hypothetical protein